MASKAPAKSAPKSPSKSSKAPSKAPLKALPKATGKAPAKSPPTSPPTSPKAPSPPKPRPQSSARPSSSSRKRESRSKERDRSREKDRRPSRQSPPPPDYGPGGPYGGYGGYGLSPYSGRPSSPLGAGLFSQSALPNFIPPQYGSLAGMGLANNYYPNSVGQQPFSPVTPAPGLNVAPPQWGMPPASSSFIVPPAASQCLQPPVSFTQPFQQPQPQPHGYYQQPVYQPQPVFQQTQPAYQAPCYPMTAVQPVTTTTPGPQALPAPRLPSPMSPPASPTAQYTIHMHHHNTVRSPTQYTTRSGRRPTHREIETMRAQADVLEMKNEELLEREAALDVEWEELQSRLDRLRGMRSPMRGSGHKSQQNDYYSPRFDFDRSGTRGMLRSAPNDMSIMSATKAAQSAAEQAQQAAAQASAVLNSLQLLNKQPSYEADTPSVINVVRLASRGDEGRYYGGNGAPRVQRVEKEERYYTRRSSPATDYDLGRGRGSRRYL